MIPFPFDPDWRDPYVVERAYLTEVMTWRDRGEQRRAHRVVPRHTISYRLGEHGSALRRLRHFLRAHQQASFVVPDLTRSVALPGAILAETAMVVMPFPEVPVWIRAGGRIVVGRDSARDFANVTAVDGLNVTLEGDFTYSHEAGAKVYPGFLATMPQEASLDFRTNAAAGMEITFDVVPSEIAEEPAGAPGLMFNGREVFLKKPNWREPPEARLFGALEVHDYQVGTVETTSFLPWNLEEWDALYLGRDAAAVDAMVRFFTRRKGQLGSFYMPTWEPDILVADSTPASVFSDDPELAVLYPALEPYKAVMAMFRDGTFEAQPVLSIAASFGGSLLSTGTWARQPTPENCRYLSWLPLVRFTTDALALEWVTDTVAQWKLGIRQIKDQA